MTIRKSADIPTFYPKIRSAKCGWHMSICCILKKTMHGLNRNSSGAAEIKVPDRKNSSFTENWGERKYVSIYRSLHLQITCTGHSYHSLDSTTDKQSRRKKYPYLLRWNQQVWNLNVSQNKNYFSLKIPKNT